MGIAENWLTIEEASRLAFNGELGKCSEDFLIDLDSSRNSKSSFLASLKKILKTDHNEDSLSLAEAKAIWRLGFLVDIVSTDKNMKEKLEEVESLWARLEYTEQWQPFIYYLPDSNEGESAAGVENLYHKLIKFIEEERIDLNV